ncbi:hypothetical protein EHQ30_13110 [Leptospira brenneri]|uniref:DUF4309 domain-containing protein n=1 Tax=Leptospira brenneri TaxID=2023182 RepID=A0A5F1Z613_9LEPT|nr:hypothetical protein [Leptospira brenneri]TGK92463.1 hypothetical protein EHQ30_13110 [Leptospira brenneri]
MTKKLQFLITISLIIYSGSIHAIDRYFILYGLKLGQKMDVASQLFGKPFKSEKFNDGFRYEAFKIKDHILVVEANNTRPDLIWGIQIQGKSNPENLGINGLNLSDNESKIIEIFGKPDEIRDSFDEITKEKISGTKYYSYDKQSNFSIETTNNLVSSIKITFNGYNQSKEEFDILNFIEILKNKNLYLVANNLATDLTLKKETNFVIQNSLIDTLISKNEFSEFLFNPETGLITITSKDVIESFPIRDKNNNLIAYYFKVSLNKKNVHVFFLRSFEGWILKEVNFNN